MHLKNLNIMWAQPSELEKFFIDLKTKHHLSEKSLKFITQKFKNIENDRNTQLLREIRKYLEENKISNHIKNIESIVENNSVQKYLNQVNSKYKLEKLIKNKYVFIEPVKIDLGVNNCHKKCHFHYVPILKTIRSLLLDEQFFHYFLANKQSMPDTYFDYNDGSVYKSNSLFQNSRAIELIFFQDAFELCNPIGSSKKKHKLIGVYMIIGNIDQKFRSAISNVQLVALCKEADAKEFGFEKILRPIVEDVKELEISGIEVKNLGLF